MRKYLFIMFIFSFLHINNSIAVETKSISDFKIAACGAFFAIVDASKTEEQIEKNFSSFDIVYQYMVYSQLNAFFGNSGNMQLLIDSYSNAIRHLSVKNGDGNLKKYNDAYSVIVRTFLYKNIKKTENAELLYSYSLKEIKNLLLSSHGFKNEDSIYFVKRYCFAAEQNSLDKLEISDDIIQLLRSALPQKYKEIIIQNLARYIPIDVYLGTSMTDVTFLHSCQWYIQAGKLVRIYDKLYKVVSENNLFYSPEYIYQIKSVFPELLQCTPMQMWEKLNNEKGRIQWNDSLKIYYFLKE